MEGPLHYLPRGWADHPHVAPPQRQQHHPSGPPRDQEALFNSLRRNMHRALSVQPGVDLLLGPSEVPHRVHGIMFGSTPGGQEGFYSLRAFNPDGLPRDTIMVFEDPEDAERYASLLEATMEPHLPEVFSIQTDQLLTFCRERSYECHLEPRGSLLIPPDCNVGVTDWERSQRLRSGEFGVLEAEPGADTHLSSWQ